LWGPTYVRGHDTAVANPCFSSYRAKEISDLYGKKDSEDT